MLFFPLSVSKTDPDRVRRSFDAPVGGRRETLSCERSVVVGVWAGDSPCVSRALVKQLSCQLPLTSFCLRLSSLRPVHLLCPKYRPAALPRPRTRFPPSGVISAKAPTKPVRSPLRFVPPLLATTRPYPSVCNVPFICGFWPWVHAASSSSKPANTSSPFLPAKILAAPGSAK